MFRAGGVILTLMPKSFWKRNPFHHGLYFYQRLYLWLKFRKKIKLDKIQKQTLARCSHVQLDLGPADREDAHLFLNVTLPKAKFEVYTITRLHNEPWQAYAQPKFLLPPQMIEKMKTFSKDLIEAPRKKPYDWLQLFSYILNILIWIIRPSTWGREVNRMLNLPGGKQVCSSGAAACLRYVEVGTVTQSLKAGAFEMQSMAGNVKLISSRTTSQFFSGYDTAMISPVMFLLEGKWETPGDIYRIDK